MLTLDPGFAQHLGAPFLQSLWLHLFVSAVHEEQIFFFAVYVFPPKQVTVRHGGCSRNLHPSLLLVSPFPCKPQSTPLSFVAFVTAEEETDFAVLPSTSEPSPKNGAYNIENLPT